MALGGDPLGRRHKAKYVAFWGYFLHSPLAPVPILLFPAEYNSSLGIHGLRYNKAKLAM